MSAPSGAPHDHLLARFKGTHVRLGRPRPHESLDLLARLVLSGGGSLWRRVEIGGDEIGGDEIGGDDELLDRCAHDGARHLPALLLGDLLEEISLNGVLQSTAISGTQRYSAGAALANQASSQRPCSPAAIIANQASSQRPCSPAAIIANQASSQRPCSPASPGASPALPTLARALLQGR